MQAQGCQSTFTLRPLSIPALRRYAAPALALVAAAVLSACAPTSSSTWGAVATDGMANSEQGARAATEALAKMAPAPRHAGSLQDPYKALQEHLDEQEVPDVDQAGVASWYGPGFHGRKTANGERYNQYDLTAAHREYAFNTHLCVRNAANGKTVVVRVNDRGPYVGKRVIDLSRAAAEEIGMLDKGVKKVEIYKLDKGEDSCHPAVMASNG